MHAGEVVPHVEQCDLVHVIVDLLRKRISQASEAARRHPHGKVLAFDVAGRNVARIRIADHFVFIGRIWLLPSVP